jgi:hypothetical protein
MILSQWYYQDIQNNKYGYYQYIVLHSNYKYISIASTNTLKPKSTVPVYGIKYGTYTTGRNKYNMDQ